MAAGKAVVSTPIRDVAGPYAGVVAIADGPRAFVAACEAALAASDGDKAAQAAARAAILGATSWDRTAREMVELIDARSQRKRGAGHAAANAQAGAARRHAAPHRDPRRGPHRPGGRLACGARQPAGRAEPERRRLVPLDRGPGLHLRLRRPHHVFQRPVRARAVPAAARGQPALAEPRGMDLQQVGVHALSVPVGAARPARAGAQGMPGGCHRGAVRQPGEARAEGVADGPVARGSRAFVTVIPSSHSPAEATASAGPGPCAGGTAQFRGIHLQGLGQRRGQALRHSLQPQAVGRAAERDGNLVAGRTRAAARPGGNDRGRAAAGRESPSAPTRASAIRCAAVSRRS
jgi:hypothetical protein